MPLVRGRNHAKAHEKWALLILIPIQIQFIEEQAFKYSESWVPCRGMVAAGKKGTVPFSQSAVMTEASSATRVAARHATAMARWSMRSGFSGSSSSAAR